MNDGVEGPSRIAESSIWSRRSRPRPRETFLWFVEEVGELSGALASRDRASIVEESTDVLMWLISIGNAMQIDLEEATETYLSNARKKGIKSGMIPDEVSR